MSSLADRLISRRELLGLTQEALAKNMALREWPSVRLNWG
jgi:transcriptional regulator with XRE-family HTH domain